MVMRADVLSLSMRTSYRLAALIIRRTSKYSRTRHGRAFPAIHVFSHIETVKTWMPGTRPGMTKIYTAPTSNTTPS